MRYIFAAVVLIGLAIMSYCMYRMLSGPHMYIQPNIRAYQAIMPLVSDGTVPLIPLSKRLPDPNKNPDLKNPLAAEPENIERGRVYYGYYCSFCHGKTGEGFGPVGFSYLPVPADLRSQKVKMYSDMQLLNASFTGTGHETVLDRTVPDEFRWYITLYIRELK